VYSLGSVLFEVLTLEPLHRGESTPVLLQSVVTPVSREIESRARAKGVAPALIEICQRATKVDPTERFQSAGEIAEAIGHFLDAQHEQQQRLRMADEHARAAESAVEKTLAAPNDDEANRRDAMTEIGRALALNPAHQGGLRAIAKLLERLPERPPEPVLAAADVETNQHIRTGLRIAALVHCAWLFALPIFLWMGIRQPLAIATFLGLELCASAIALLASRRAQPPEWPISLLVVTNIACIALLTGVLGSLVLVPMLALGHSMPIMLHPARRVRIAALVLGCAVVIVPSVLGWLDVTAPSYGFRDGDMTIAARWLSLTPLPTMGLLLVVSLATLVSACWFISALRAAITRADLRVRLVAWQFRQLLPAEALGEGGAHPGT
jgi:serine/threonine-protein kinase